MTAVSLPEPGAEARAASAALVEVIAAEIAGRGGFMSFARFMELALYAPGLGYYSGGAHKFGDFAAGGDFVTAPEISPLFGGALARQVAQVLGASRPRVLEVGAGSGRLAADLLPALDALGALPERYAILELSGTLRARQQATLAADAPAYLARVEWLDQLPESLEGCVLGNELLDAMPTHQVLWTPDGLREGGVAWRDGRLTAADAPVKPALADAARAFDIQPPYRGEIALAVRAWVAEMARRLTHGALLLIDYGLPRHELYHPARDGGTLRCHYRHGVHDDPFWYPGLSDITSHVDFTAVAEAAHDAGLRVAGYTTQAMFLMNCGLGELLANYSGGGTAPASPDARHRAHGAVQRLVAPHEMGELFKVIAATRGIDAPLVGFARGDRTHAL